MADNYLEKQYEAYEARKAAWEKERKYGKKTFPAKRPKTEEKTKGSEPPPPYHVPSGKYYLNPGGGKCIPAIVNPFSLAYRRKCLRDFTAASLSISYSGTNVGMFQLKGGSMNQISYRQ